MRDLALVLLATSLLAGATPAPPSAWTDGYVYTNGIRLHYWRTGAGSGKPVIVMAHGSSDDALCWTNLAKEITGQYDVIMFDARGHGWSDPPKAGDPADAQVEDLAGLIGELKLDRPILMGHSMGSFSVAWFAAKYPNVPRAIILEDPNLTGRPMTAAPKRTEAELRAVMIGRNNQSEEELVAGCLKNSPKWGRAECEVWAPSKRRHHPDTAVYPNNAGRPPVKELFAKIAVPTLILKADAEGEARKTNEETAALLAKGKIVHITGAGHNVRRENKAMTLETLNAFLAGLK
jgi:pimeloyl-ACP methyl ester carboxylesterase